MTRNIVGRTAGPWPFRWVRYGDIYHLWPVFSSVGGTLAGWCADGTVLPREQWHPAFIEAISALIELRRAAPALLDEKLTRDAAEALFLEGKTPYFISACGRLGHVLDRSIAIRTATVPPLARIRPGP